MCIYIDQEAKQVCALTEVDVEEGGGELLHGHGPRLRQVVPCGGCRGEDRVSVFGREWTYTWGDD